MSEFGGLRKHENTQHALKRNSWADASHHVVVTVLLCVSERVRSTWVCVLRQFVALWAMVTMETAPIKMSQQGNFRRCLYFLQNIIVVSSKPVESEHKNISTRMLETTFWDDIFLSERRCCVQFIYVVVIRCHPTEVSVWISMFDINVWNLSVIHNVFYQNVTNANVTNDIYTCVCRNE